MASFAIKPFQQVQLRLSLFPYYNSSALDTFQFPSFHPLSVSKPKRRKAKLQGEAPVGAKLSRETVDEVSRTAVCAGADVDFPPGFPPYTDISETDGKVSPQGNRTDAGEVIERRVIPKDRHKKTGLGRKVVGSGGSSVRLAGENFVSVVDEAGTFNLVDEVADNRCMKGENNGVDVVQRTQKSKFDPPKTTLRIGLDLCSKTGDVVGAIKLYELAKKEGIKMGQYHYAVLLYLCSSAVTGMLQPAKSGSGNRSLSPGAPSRGTSVVGSQSSSEFGEMANWSYGRRKLSQQNLEGEPAIEPLERNEFFPDDIPIDEVGSIYSNGRKLQRNVINGSMENCAQTLEGLVQSIKNAFYSSRKPDGGKVHRIQVSDNVKRVALRKGFEMFNDMCTEKVPMNEATLTSVARMAVAFGDGDMAFDIVKKMKEHGINPRLRSYGPALAIFCGNGDVEKAFIVEKHMLEHGVSPKEPELEALLRVSVESGKNDKVYYVLHKLRTSVRLVSQATADLIEKWFESKIAARVGKRKWDKQMINQAIQNVGGGWHGKGWLGQGKWSVCRSSVGSDGLCKSCGEKLVTIDLDPAETENFAKSVASLASRREKNSSFQKFQKWLDYYGPFEAVVDAANVGLQSQRRLKPAKVNAVVNGIRQMLPSRKWPLIVLHNRRITGVKMDEPVNRSLIERWKNADALYATPSGSNDDWYWLYAAIKCRCLIVTNDEMRDHLFQVLGTDFFPKWKERHQVRFSFTETGHVFHMPPPCSLVIQESDNGHWHIPIISELENENQRVWLCCTRANSRLQRHDSLDVQRESHVSHQKKSKARLDAGAKSEQIEPRRRSRQGKSEQELEELSLKVDSLAPMRNQASILAELESAEILGGCVIDFQI